MVWRIAPIFSCRSRAARPNRVAKAERGTFSASSRAVDQEIDNAKRSLTTALQLVASHWQAEFQYSQARLVVDDLAHRIAALNRRMKEEGVNEESLKILQQVPLYGRARNFFGSVKAKVGEDTQSPTRLEDTILRVDVGTLTDARAFSEVEAVRQAILSAREVAAGCLDKGVEAVEALKATLNDCREGFESWSKSFAESLEQATAAQQAHKALLEELKKLTEQQMQDEAALAKASEHLSATAVHKADFEKAITEFDGLLEKRRSILSESAQLVQQRSGNLKAKMKPDRKPDEYVRPLAGVLEGSTVRDVQGRCPAWVEGVMANGGGGWIGVRDALLGIYRQKIGTGKPQAPDKDLSEKIVAFCKGGDKAISETAASRIYAKLNVHIVSDVIAVAPRNYIHLTYIDEARKKVPFDRASPGQQASALLELLLQQQAGTLVIDLPEDDLGNHVIMRIVNLIKTSKNQRQLIFATHNPNLVVNGDADKIVVLKSASAAASAAASIEIDVDGAIGTWQVRDAITTFMEGGRAAFDLRGKKYKFDLA